jgi:putative beta-barrel porin BBP2
MTDLRSRVRAVLLLTILLNGSPSALAQTPGQATFPPDTMPAQPPDRAGQPRPFGQLHVGGLRATPVFTLRDVGIDTNVFDTPTDAKADFTTTFAPGARVELDMGRIRIQTDGTLRLVYYATYEEARAVNPAANALGEIRLGKRIRVFGGGAYDDTQTRTGPDVAARVPRITRSAFAGVSYAISKKTAVDVGASQGSVAYADGARYLGVNVRDTLNRRTDEVAVRMRHVLTPLTAVGLTVTSGSIRYPYFAEKDHDHRSLVLSTTFQRRALVSGTADLGWEKARPYSPVVPPYSGMVANLTLFHTFRESTQLGILFARNAGTSYDPTSPYAIENRYGLTVRRHVVRRIEALATAQWWQRAFASFQLPAGPALSPNDKEARRLYTGEVRVPLTKRLRVGWFGEFDTRESPRSSLFDYGGFRTGFLVSYGMFTIGNRGEQGGFTPW